MDAEKLSTGQAIMKTTREAYDTYLEIEGLQDHVSVKIGFLETIAHLMREEPHPDAEIQEYLLRELGSLSGDALDDALGLVQGVFMSTVEDGVR